MVANAHVFTIADYYAMASLKERALEKLLARAHGGSSDNGCRWPTDALAHMLHIVARRVRAGDTLYDVVFAAATEQASQLVVHRRFRQLMRAGGVFAAEFAAGLAAHHELGLAAQRERAEKVAARHKEQLERTKTELLLVSAQNEALQRKIELFDALLDKHVSCRHCDADFSCFFDTGEECLRCSKCRTRHFS
jgi:hypothetical protein